MEETVKLAIVGEVALNHIPELAKKDFEQISEDLKETIKCKIEGVIPRARPIEYFNCHPMFSKVLPVVEDIVGIKYAPAFIELAIYSHFCTHSLEEYVACVQAYWVDDAMGDTILDNESLVKFWELCHVVKWVFIPRRKVSQMNSSSDERKYKSIGCYRFEGYPPNDTVFPNEFYYCEKYSCAKTMGKYHTLSLLVINDMVKMYGAYFENNPERHYTDIFKSLEPICSDIDRSGGEFTLNSPYITSYKNSPLAQAFLISLAKASGDIPIANSAILSTLPAECIRAFRSLFWLCDKYLEYDLATLYPQYMGGGISDCISLYNTDFKFEEGAHILETPENEFLNFQDAINLLPSHEMLEDEDINSEHRFPVKVEEKYILPLCDFVASNLLAEDSIKELQVIKYVFFGCGKKPPYATRLVFKKGKKGRLVNFVKTICKHEDISPETWCTLNEWIVEVESTDKYLSEINSTSNCKSKYKETYDKELFTSLKKNSGCTYDQIREDFSLKSGDDDSKD